MKLEEASNLRLKPKAQPATETRDKVQKRLLFYCYHRQSPIQLNMEDSGYAVANLFEELRYKPEGRGLECH